MSRKIIIGDTHIDEVSIPELEKTMEEILTHDAEECIHLGDFFDKKRPSPDEIKFGTYFALELQKKYGKVTILKGNHDTSTDKSSAIDYLGLLGFNVVDVYVDEWNNLYGHFFTDQSLYEYGTHKYTTKELHDKYNYVLLGHQHSPQNISKFIYHLGSSRYVNFNEVGDSGKQLAFIDSPERLCFSPLESPIKMYDIEDIGELPNVPKRSKVRMVINSFAQFKREIAELSKWKKEFEDFKIKLSFENLTEAQLQPDKQLQNMITLEQMLNEELNKIEDKEVRELLKAQFDKEGTNE